MTRNTTVKVLYYTHIGIALMFAVVRAWQMDAKRRAFAATLYFPRSRSFRNLNRMSILVSSLLSIGSHLYDPGIRTHSIVHAYDIMSIKGTTSQLFLSGFVLCDDKYLYSPSRSIYCPPPSLL